MIIIGTEEGIKSNIDIKVIIPIENDKENVMNSPILFILIKISKLPITVDNHINIIHIKLYSNKMTIITIINKYYFIYSFHNNNRW